MSDRCERCRVSVTTTATGHGYRGYAQARAKAVRPDWAPGRLGGGGARLTFRPQEQRPIAATCLLPSEWRWRGARQGKRSQSSVQSSGKPVAKSPLRRATRTDRSPSGPPLPLERNNGASQESVLDASRASHSRTRCPFQRRATLALLGRGRSGPHRTLLDGQVCSALPAAPTALDKVTPTLPLCHHCIVPTPLSLSRYLQPSPPLSTDTSSLLTRPVAL